MERCQTKNMSAASDAQNADLVEINKSEDFWTVLSMEIKDVEFKIANTETVTYSFGCRSDPRPIIFELTLMFGNEKEGFLSLYISSSHDVSLTFAETTLRDPEMVELRRHKTEAHFQLGPEKLKLKSGRTGYPEFYQFTQSSKGVWKISMEIRYESTAVAGNAATEKTGHTRLQKDFLSLLESSRNADITFCFDDGKMPAHKLVLSARAPYFANMFESGMKETSSNEVHIKDVESRVFAGILHYLYSGTPPNNLEEIALGLLVAADKYGLDDLKSLCEANVCDHLQANNVVDALIVADRINCPNLRDKAKVVMRSKIESLGEESTKKLRDNPKLLFDLAVHFSKM